MEGRRRRSERTSGSATPQFQYGVGNGNAGGSPYALSDSLGSGCGAGEFGAPSYMSPPIGYHQQHQPGRLGAYGLGSSPAGSGASSMINSRNGSFNNLQGMVSGASFEHQQPYSPPFGGGPATSGEYFHVGGGGNAGPAPSADAGASGSVNFGSLHSTNSADLSENELRLLIGRILHEHGKASVGKLGSLIHSYTNNHRLSAMCKERFGGLKKFLELHADLFAVGADHPFNPSVWLHAVHHSAAVFGGM
jgi:hypothetical protein